MTALHQSTPSVALVLQYHSADFRQAMTLARFIADLEPQRRSDVVFRFVYRHDAPKPDMRVIQEMAKKFDISWARADQYRWTGWPAGPNAMAKDILGWAEEWLVVEGWSCVRDILLIEPDCVPVARDWLDQLLSQRATQPDAWVMGSWRDSGGVHGHLNGNCFVRVDRAAQIAALIGPDLAWDCAHTPLTRSHWHITGLIRNDFQGTGATEEILRTPEVGERAPVLVHGYKDDSALRIARRWLSISSP